MSKIITFTSIFFAHCIHLVSFTIPRSKSLWVHIGWHVNDEREIFADNSKYFFLYLHNNRPHVSAVWIAKDEKFALLLRGHGFKAYQTHSLLGIYFALRASYTVVDARIHRTNWKFCGGSKIVQLWHGKGMKRSGHNSFYNNEQSYFFNPSFFTTYDYLFATSKKTAEFLSKTFNHPIKKIQTTGHPRTDIFFKKINGSQIDEHTTFNESINKAEKCGVKKVIFYAPTFRADGSNPLQQLDLDRLNETLIKLNYYFLIQLHPKFSSRKLETKPNTYSHIQNIQPGHDPYPFFHKVDLLITDYSNIYIDFLLLDKEIIFFTYDRKDYQETTGLYDDFDDLTPGLHVQNFNELLHALSLEDVFKTERKRVKNILFKHTDGDSALRIYNLITA